jgi:legumain
MSDRSSHVMEYGNQKLSNDSLFTYIGTNPANDNYAFVEYTSSTSTVRAVSQRDASLLYFWHKVCCL